MNTITNQLICFEKFRDELGWDDYMCAALVGCIITQSNINASYINKEQKNESIQYVSDYDTYGSYEAGLIGWKNVKRKESALIYGLNYTKEKAEECIKMNGIESLSLSQQLNMICGEILNGSYKNNFGIAIKKCETLKDAVATVFCRYIHGFSVKDNPANDSDIKRLDKDYDGNNKKTPFIICLKYADQVLDNYHHSIDL